MNKVFIFCLNIQISPIYSQKGYPNLSVKKPCFKSKVYRTQPINRRRIPMFLTIIFNNVSYRVPHHESPEEDRRIVSVTNYVIAIKLY